VRAKHSTTSSPSSSIAGWPKQFFVHSVQMFTHFIFSFLVQSHVPRDCTTQLLYFCGLVNSFRRFSTPCLHLFFIRMWGRECYILHVYNVEKFSERCLPITVSEVIS
jgi:hypothetical protein